MAGYRDPWILLGVERSATDADIKRAYRQKAREYHPDRNKGDKERSILFQEIARAYDEIKNAPARAIWVSEHEGGGNTIFSPVPTDFEEYEISQSPPTLRRDVVNKDIQEAVVISFLESFRGTNKELNLEVEEQCRVCGGSGAAPGHQPHRCLSCRGTGEHKVGTVSSPCSNCDGKGYIIAQPCPNCHEGLVKQKRPFVLNVPAGVRDGQTLRLPGPRQGRLGVADIVVTVRVQPSAIFRRTLRDAADLLIIVPISYSEACLGASIRVPTPDKNIALRVPAGTQSGKAFRIPGRGMPKLGVEGLRGDLYARVQVLVPTEMSGPQHKLIQQLGNYDSSELRKGLFAINPEN